MIPIHNICGIILAAGASERMGEPKANLKCVDGSTLLSRQAQTLMTGGIKNIYVVTGAHTLQIRESNGGLDVTGTSKNLLRSEILIPSSETRKMSKKTGGFASSYVDGFFVKSDEVDACGAKLQPKEVFRGALKWIENPDWQAGQFTSVQAGIKAALRKNAEGALILPVDTANVAPLVVSSLIEASLANPHLAAVVPENNGKCGHPVYLSASFMQMAAGLDPSLPDSRLDILLKKEKQKIIISVSDPNIASNINSLEDWERFRER